MNSSHTGTEPGRLTIRRAGAADTGSLARLASLDSAHAPVGAVLVAERDGRMVAAVPFEEGRAIADPFEPTADVVALLELRARQIQVAEGACQERPGLIARLRARFA